MKLAGSKFMILSALALTLGLGTNQGSLPNLAALVRSEGTTWINTDPLSRASLRGKVVLVDFWTYSCINSLRNLRYIQSWAARYKKAGLIVIGVHSPEFSFEKDPANVENAVRVLGITYPVAIDSNHLIWRAFQNEYWPADYLIDGTGNIRYHQFGEGNYAESERVIQALLKQNGASDVKEGTTVVSGTGVERAPSDNMESAETYVGSDRAENFASPQRLGAPETYTVPRNLPLNDWALGGSWVVGSEAGLLQSSGGKIVFRFHARDFNMVLGPAERGRPIRFTVKVDGHAPLQEHGIDTAADGHGVVTDSRLYQLIRQNGPIGNRAFEIDFRDPGVKAFSFTFG
jgi:thiol-disulfide isomerase/thioredoxin